MSLIHLSIFLGSFSIHQTLKDSKCCIQEHFCPKHWACDQSPLMLSTTIVKGDTDREFGLTYNQRIFQNETWNVLRQACKHLDRLTHTLRLHSSESSHPSFQKIEILTLFTFSQLAPATKQDTSPPTRLAAVTAFNVMGARTSLVCSAITSVLWNRWNNETFTTKKARIAQ